jgi:hypothetical protein
VKPLLLLLFLVVASSCGVVTPSAGTDAGGDDTPCVLDESSIDACTL